MILLVLSVISYILILLGLTIWFEKYHYYKENYFQKISTELPDSKKITLVPSSDCHTRVNSETSQRQKAKRGVQRRKVKKASIKKFKGGN